MEMERMARDRDWGHSLRFLVVPPQAPYEIPMDSQCISHGFQWIPQGFIMDALWIFCGILVDSILILCGFPLDSFWITQGILVVSHGLPMD